MHRITARVGAAADHHDVADLQRRAPSLRRAAWSARPRGLSGGSRPGPSSAASARSDRDRATCVIAPVRASRTTPSRRNAQQSYATETKKLAGSRFSTPTLQPMSDTRPPNPIVPTPSVFTVRMISASRSARRESGLTSSSDRNSCSFACSNPTCDRRRCRRRPRPARSLCPAPATPRAGCTCARLRWCDRRGPDAPAPTGASTARSCSRSRRP